MNEQRGVNATFAVSIGGANIDIQGKPAQPLRSNDSNPGMVHTSVGGVARNVAENLARLGVDSRLISMVGEDHFGRMLLRQSKAAGIDVRHVQVSGSAPTSTYLSVLDDTGDMHLAISDMDVLDELKPEHLKRLQPVLQDSSLIIIDSNLGDDMLAWLASEFSAIPIFADSVSTHKAGRLKPYLSGIHTLKTTAMEAEELAGENAGTPAQLEKVVRKLHDCGVERVFVTRGKHGVYYSSGDQRGMREPLQMEAKTENSGGAGDAFLAGLAYSWLADLDLQDSLRFALATAHITLQHAASSNPALSVSAVEQLLEKQGGT